MVTRVPPYETFSLIKNNIPHQSKNYKNDLDHVTYSFINMLFISTGIVDDKLCPQILSLCTTAYAALSISNPTCYQV